MYIYIYLEPKCPLFGLEKTLFWRQNKGQMGSRYIYIYTKTKCSMYMAYFLPTMKTSPILSQNPVLVCNKKYHQSHGVPIASGRGIPWE